MQLLKNLKSIQDETTAIELVVKKIEEELDSPILQHFSRDDKVRISQGVVKFSTKITPENVHVSKKDVFGGITIFFRCMCGIGATNPIFYIAEPDGYGD